jgi:diguanylate cyclase (GGDEF)-like protein
MPLVAAMLGKEPAPGPTGAAGPGCRVLKWVVGDVDSAGVERVSSPDDDKRRITSLRRLGLLDTPPEERFDRITRITHDLFGADSVTFTLVDVDRSWVKSEQGVTCGQRSQLDAFCARTVLDRGDLDGRHQATIVTDALPDGRLSDGPRVPDGKAFRFYAGAPVAGPDGAVVGALCLADRRPRTLDAHETRSLRDVADLVEREIAVGQLAVDDELTGLANRRGFLMMATQALAFCERQQAEALVVVAGVDGLATVNRTFGAPAGDQLLRHAASAVADAFRASDVVGRISGGRFGIVLTSYLGEEPWATKRLATGVQACNDQMTDEPFTLSMATGCARFDPDDPELLEILIDSAATAMCADQEYRRELAAHGD